MTAIVFVASAWGSLHGGVNSFNQDLACAVAKSAPSGVRVACAVPNPQQHQIDAALCDRVTLVALAKDPAEFDRVERESVVRQLGQEPDWWIGHDRFSGLFANAAAADNGSRSAVVVHTDYRAYAPIRGIPGSKIFQNDQYAKDIVRGATRVFGVGPKLVAAAHDLQLGTESSIKEVVPGLGQPGHSDVPMSVNAIMFGRFEPPDDRLKQVRLAAAGFGRFVRVADLSERSPKLTFIGTRDSPDGLSDELGRLAEEEAHAAQSVVCTDFLENRNILHGILQDCSVCLVLSTHEGFGLSAWEALSADVPLILAKNTGLHQLLMRVGGHAVGCVKTVKVAPSLHSPYYREASVEPVVDALREIHEDSRRAKDDAKELRRVLQGFTWENAASKFLSDLGLLRIAPGRTDLHTLADSGRGQTHSNDGFRASQDRPSRIYNPPPAVIPSDLRDRRPQQEQLVTLLRDTQRCLLVLHGPVGSGKTALVSTVINTLDDEGFFLLDYLSAVGPFSVTGARVAERLAVMARLPFPMPSEQESEDRDWYEQVERVLRRLAEPVLLVLDQVENLLDHDGRFRDRSLHRLLQRLVESNDHTVHVLLVTARQPHPDLFNGSSTGSTIELKEPLPLHEARHLLQDFAGDRPLPTALVLQQDRAIELTQGHPRELELFVALFSTDTRLQMHVVDDELERVSRPGLRTWLVRRIWTRLNKAQQRVLTALAVLGFPATTTDLRDVLRGGLVDSGTVKDTLDALVSIRLVRQISTSRFDVPPSDASLILACWGDDAHADKLRAGLMARVADHCSKLTERREARRVEDLGPHLREIELRLRLGQRGPVLERMHRLDQSYLKRWGYQHILARWRLDLAEWQVGTHYWYANISALADGMLELDEVDEAANQLERALDRLPLRSSSEGSIDPVVEQAIDDRLALITQLGRAHWLAGSSDRAAGRYAQERAEAVAAGRHYAAARACLGIAECRIDLGRLDEANEMLTNCERHASHNAPAAADPKTQLLRANLSFSRATLARLAGEYPRAQTLAHQAQKLALEAGNRRLQIRVLDFTAALHLDEDEDGDSAVELAEEASRLASRTGVNDISRTAHATLAFAYLYQQRTDDALSAARAAARFFPSRRALIGAVALAVALLREGQTAAALEACTDATTIVDQFPKYSRPYWVWDSLGAAEAVRWACREEGARRRSVAAYDQARQLTPAPGARRRARVILNTVFAAINEEGSREIRRAAERGKTMRADATGSHADGASPIE